MERKNLEVDDVKEYKPRKKAQNTGGHFMDNYNVSPSGSERLLEKDNYFDGDGVASIDSGIMMSTSEIIDFGEGTDSWTNRH